MPRDLNGNYFLPAGNPVQTGTIIDTNWANPTMDDVAATLSDSLSRSGSGPMTAPLRLPDGSNTVPALAFTTGVTTGFYKAAQADIRLSLLTTDSMRWTQDGVDIWDADDSQFYRIITAKSTGATEETQTLDALQTVVPFTAFISGASLYLNGVGVDQGRLLRDTDYTYDAVANEVTLATDYPAGTLLTAVYNDQSIANQAAFDAQQSALAAAVSEANAANSQALAEANEQQTTLDAAETAANVVQTNTDAAATAADRAEVLILKDATVDAANTASTAAGNAQTAQGLSETARDESVAAKDAALVSETNAAASAVSADEDATQTAADRVQTGNDATATANDVLATNADAAATANDVLATNADAAATAADRVQTGNDATATANDAAATANDVIATEAARDKAQQWAENPEDVPVETGQFSAFHWAQKAGNAVVSSVNGEVGDVVLDAGDVGAYTQAEVDTEIADGIVAHVAQSDPHPQYLTPDDLPSTIVGWLTDNVSGIDPAFTQSLGVAPASPQSTEIANVPDQNWVQLGQWLREPVFTDSFTWQETSVTHQLDVECDASNVELAIDFYVRRADTTEELVATSDFRLLNNARETYTLATLVQGPIIINSGDAPLTRIKVRKSNTTGGARFVTLYMEGDNTTRAITFTPVATAPANHAVTHEVGGSDLLDHDNLTNAQGFKSHSQIDSDLAGLSASIAGLNTTDWDAAFSWGDHALAGYALAAGLNTTDWDTAFSWGDHALAGYALGSDVVPNTGGVFTGEVVIESVVPAIFFKETDVVDNNAYLYSNGGSFSVQRRNDNNIYEALAFVCNLDGPTTLYYNGDPKFATSSTGVSVTGVVVATGGSSTNWNTAYGWGDHALAGYALSSGLNTANWNTAYGWGDHAGLYVPVGGNAGSADSLSTARTISLTGDVSGSTSFNGTANVSITATVANSSHTHSAANITSGTLTAARGGTGRSDGYSVGAVDQRTGTMKFWSGTQTQYDALTPSIDTVYFISG